MQLFIALLLVLSTAVYGVDSCSNTTVWTFSDPDYRLCLVGDQVFVQGNGNDVMKLYIDGGVNVQGATSSFNVGSSSNPMPSGSGNPMWKFTYENISAPNNDWFRVPNIRAWGGFNIFVAIYNTTGAGNYAKYCVGTFTFMSADWNGNFAQGTPMPEQHFSNISIFRQGPVGEVKLRPLRGGHTGYDPALLEIFVEDWSNYTRLDITFEEIPHLMGSSITDDSLNPIAPNYPQQTQSMMMSSGTGSSTLNSAMSAPVATPPASLSGIQNLPNEGAKSKTTAVEENSDSEKIMKLEKQLEFIQMQLQSILNSKNTTTN